MCVCHKFRLKKHREGRQKLTMLRKEYFEPYFYFGAKHVRVVQQVENYPRCPLSWWKQRIPWPKDVEHLSRTCRKESALHKRSQQEGYVYLFALNAHGKRQGHEDKRNFHVRVNISVHSYSAKDLFWKPLINPAYEQYLGGAPLQHWLVQHVTLTCIRCERV